MFKSIGFHVARFTKGDQESAWIFPIAIRMMSLDDNFAFAALFADIGISSLHAALLTRLLCFLETDNATLEEVRMIPVPLVKYVLDATHC
jgi:hypothetical protein